MKTKKILSLGMILCLLASFILPALAEDAVKVSINGQYVPFDVPPIIQNERMLVPVRAVFETMGYDVYWEDEQQPVILVKNDIKLVMWQENKSFYKFTGNDSEVFKQQMLRGFGDDIEKYYFDVAPQVIDGRMLIPVRGVCEAMGINVFWDDMDKRVSLTCDNDFVLAVNTDKTFAAQAFRFFRELKDPGTQEEQDSPRYEENNLDILAELDLVTEEELNKDGYITNLEVLELLHKIIVGEKTQNISEWYRGYTLESMDYLDDSCKSLLLGLLRSGKNPILTYDDILNIELDNPITNYKALIYITRMIGDTYGCTDYPIELDFTEKSQTYQTAYEKGLIEQIEIENADLPILRKDFYAILHKAVFVEKLIGGDSPSKGRVIDSVINRNKKMSQPEKEVVVNTKEIPIKTTINGDMSISWTLPDEYKELAEKDCFTEISTVTDSGEIKNHFISGELCTQISTSEVIRFAAGAYPEKLEYIRCVYYEPGNKSQTKEKWMFDIDLSDITVQIEGEEVIPGIYTHFKNQWVAQSISLADGESFKKDAYYLLTSYQHTYRNPEYNSVNRAIFRAKENSNIFLNPERGMFETGSIYLDEVHIQEVLIDRNSKGRFTVRITPESKEAFKVIEG